MTSTSVISIIVVIFAFILVDIFCGDVTNTRQNGQLQINQNSPDILPEGKSTTPWPTLGRRRTPNPNYNRNNQLSTGSSTPGPRKWIQQNNIWIRNEQAASGGEVAPQNVNSNNSNRQAVRGQQSNSGRGGSATTEPSTSQNPRQQGSGHQTLGGQQQNAGSSTTNNRQTHRGDSHTNVRPQIHQTNRQQALVDGLGGNQQKVGSSTTNNRQINGGDSQMNGNHHQTNRQQALINGLGGNHQNLGPVNPSLPPQSFPRQPLNPLPVSSTTPGSPTAPTNKPMSYAGAVGPKTPTPVSPIPPKTPPVSRPASPLPGGPKKAEIPFTGPTGSDDNLGGNQNGNSAANGDVTDEELREFSEMLLRKDTNNAMKYVTLNLQGMTTSRSEVDQAPLPLLKIDPEGYKIPSIEKMILLYNNYFLDAGQNEVYTGAERIEENNLLDTVLATPVMQFARSFLIQKGKIGKDPKEFKDLLRLIWFNMYSRGQGRIGSSGFEHIFLAEIKNNQVSGLHNWVYFNEEESNKRANYLGYLKKLDLGDKGAILKYHFTFHDIDKPVGSMFIGTSPELEIALYSTCFILRADKICPLKMNGNKFIIRTYTYRYRGKNMIGSAFPEI